MRISRSNEAVSSPAVEVEGAADPEAKLIAPEQPSHFARLIHGLGRELDRGEALAEGAIRHGGAGGGMSPEGLIALQAGIYRYSEAVDLVTKLVDRGSQAVKTTLQNQ
ncbi:MAG TPA: hypothetical protein VF881_08205 [Polyangiaceae bacterium]